MNASKYFRELTLNLQRAGFTVGPEVNSLLPVALDGERLSITTEYIQQMEAAPILKASGLDEDQ